MVLTYTPLRRQQHNTIKANDYVLGLMSMQRLLYLLERMKEKRIRREKKTNEKTSDRMQKKKRKIDGPPLTSFCLCHDTLYISLIFFWLGFEPFSHSFLHSCIQLCWAQLYDDVFFISLFLCHKDLWFLIKAEQAKKKRTDNTLK